MSLDKACSLYGAEVIEQLCALAGVVETVVDVDPGTRADALIAALDRLLEAVERGRYDFLAALDEATAEERALENYEASIAIPSAAGRN